MTDGLDQALVNAGLNLLRADTSPPALVVYDGSVPDGATRPYVVVFSYVERPTDHPDSALDGLSRTYMCTWICHCVGDTEMASRAVAQRVRTQMLDSRPLAIVGLSLGLIRQRSVLPPTKDEATQQLVVDTTVTYSITATS